MDLDKRDKDAAMSDTVDITVEMQAITRRAAEPLLPGDSVKAAILRASRTLGIGYRRAWSFWYGESVSVRAIEADRMRAAELLLLAQRSRRLAQELASIRARLDAAKNHQENHQGAAARAALARREGLGGGKVAGETRVKQ